jgi:hypothetical protein
VAGIDCCDINGCAWRRKEMTEYNGYDELPERLKEDIRVARWYAEYYQGKYEETLHRLHQCKRRNREDKVKLRNQMATLECTVKCWYNAYRLLEEESKED